MGDRIIHGNLYNGRKKLLGTVSIGDVVNHIIDQYKEENQHLKDFINKY